jgi:hypothetical protein
MIWMYSGTEKFSTTESDDGEHREHRREFLARG